MYRAQLTTLSLSYPYATKDRTEPYLAKLSKGSCQGLQGEQALDVQESALFLRGSLNKGLYCVHKDKGYAIEVVTTTKNDSDKTQSRQYTARRRDKKVAIKAKSKDSCKREEGSYKRRPRKALGLQK